MYNAHIRIARALLYPEVMRKYSIKPTTHRLRYSLAHGGGGSGSSHHMSCGIAILQRQHPYILATPQSTIMATAYIVASAIAPNSGDPT
jgi:hypothetical protein